MCPRNSSWTGWRPNSSIRTYDKVMLYPTLPGIHTQGDQLRSENTSHIIVFLPERENIVFPVETRATIESVASFMVMLVGVTTDSSCHLGQ